MSEFEEIFGQDANISDDTDNLIAIIRDKFYDKLNHYAPESSLMSSPGCCLFAIYKLLDNDIVDKEFISYEKQREKS